MGIDYGTKRIGVAFSDEREVMAFPHGVLINEGNIVDIINSLADKEGVKKIVIGDPGENSIKEDIRYLKEGLSNLGFDVHLEKEFMTSLHVDMMRNKKPIARKTKKDVSPKKDDLAATLILQRYLDKNNS